MGSTLIWTDRLPSVFRWLVQPRAETWRATVARIGQLEPRHEALREDDLRRQFLALRYRAGCGEPLRKLLPETYALVREAARRACGMRHYDVQLWGGAAIFDGSIAEMQTGEGKTLTATLPMCLASLPGKGAHLATANDYLAGRDAELMRPVYEMLGLQVGVVQAHTPSRQRAEAYACDLTYTTAKELGFDFLRDRLYRADAEQHSGGLFRRLQGESAGGSAASVVQRGHFFALVDEADSILIDEARTPLIVSALPGADGEALRALYQWSAQAALEFTEDRDYTYDAPRRAATLTAAGRSRTRAIAKPPALDAIEMFDIYEQVERAIKVNLEFVRDRHYVVRDGEVVIVDEFTGRLAEGRKWREGIHQAVEARENLEITLDAGEAARIAVQDYFLRYQQLGGMTGTAATSRRELQQIYSLLVADIPTNRPPQRQAWPSRVFADADAKWRAIVEETLSVAADGRPVLIGTRSIDKSETVAALLRDAGVEHEVLNARQSAAEARLIAEAGRPGRVTVATNMAGRGTDIELPAEALKAGGLHVVCSELHESARIDRQLIGRCGRQGDPGSYRQFLALDDEILSLGYGPEKARKLQRTALRNAARLDRFARWFHRAQAKVEQTHFQQRRMLLAREKQRRQLQREMGQDPYLDAAE